MVGKFFSALFLVPFVGCFLAVFAFMVISIFSVPDLGIAPTIIAALVGGSLFGSLFTAFEAAAGKKMLGFLLYLTFILCTIGFFLYLIKVVFGAYTDAKLFMLLFYSMVWLLAGFILTAMNYWTDHDILILDH